MSLKQKNERAWRKVVQDTLPGDTALLLVTSQENQEVTRGKQMYCFIDLGGPERPPKSKVYYRRTRALAKTSFDKQTGDTSNPEEVHGANVVTLKNAVNQANLVALLSAAQADYHVLGVIDEGEAEVDPDTKGRAFVDGFDFTTICLENDCT